MRTATSDVTPTNSQIVAAYRARTPGSARLASRARELLPGGLVHDARQLDPYPIYVNRARGARKWDVDGNEYVDYYGGHGALLLGHCHPAVMEAVHRQLDLGTHYAACHELEVRWAEHVRRLVPCAERVRFTSSGTEANLMALRLARAYTRKPMLVRFKGHFHGWQDHVASGYDSHFDGSPSPGVLPGIAENVLIAPPDDIDSTVALLRERDDVAALILEPTGASFGWVPMRREFVAELRRVTAERGVVLIFDEVVTGFRVSPGGAQAHGGAVTGRAAILDLLDYDEEKRAGVEKISHHGTFNANPTSAAAGVACLETVAETGACERASERAARLRGMLNEVFFEQGVAWAAYGEHSAVYLFTNPFGIDVDPRAFDAFAMDAETMRTGGRHPAAGRLRLALMVNGVDISGKPGGITSCVHSDADLERTAEGMRRAVIMLKEEGELA